jgi:simple sugar transport system permease protein
MKSKLPEMTLTLLSFLFFTAGTVLYLASLFWGVGLILIGLVFYLLKIGVTAGWPAVAEKTLSGLKKMSGPLIGIIAALLIGAVILLFTGHNPLVSYGALFYGGLFKNWHVSVLNAVPLIFTGLSIALAFQAGLFNIGAEGQYYVGSMAATWLAIRIGLPFGLAIPFIFLAGGAAAALWNLIPTLLKNRTGASEVVTTMMFAYIAGTYSTIFVRNNGGDPATSEHAYVTDAILESNWLMVFQKFLPSANYRLHIGILVAIAMALAVHWFLYKTMFGYEIRAVGKNKTASRAQGINVNRIVLLAMLLAGFLAGCAGITQVLGLEHKMYQNLAAGYGWNGISVALLAGNEPIAIIFTALLWGVLDAGGQFMARTTQTNNSIVEIIKGITLFLILAKYLTGRFSGRLRRIFQKGKGAGHVGS